MSESIGSYDIRFKDDCTQDNDPTGDVSFENCPYHGDSKIAEQKRREIFRNRTTQQTSAAANTAITPAKTALRTRVFDAIANAGRRGLTDNEVQEALQLDGNTQRPRRKELEQAGKVKPAGVRANANGRSCTVWVAA